ncbi:DUF6557 family protein [Desulfofundulus thermocisternus]|uniref:DUF6557 family protein n=1 Tax=Desulfofundulus thermocisternus TaxID=42471 RepID=UPI001A0E113A|nr:DUF6557 family protein [Desulfofundulus thermocisternus]MBE3586618.1 hypothetical protein [Thermoanaerobacter sp.]MCS5697349.1 hypothetical protein [Desulfofundulus thermocisternus]
MTVQELFRAVSWDDVAGYIAGLYPDEVESLPGFEKVFLEVRECEPVPDPQETMVCIELVENDDGDYYDVYGCVPGEDKCYALDFCLFREWAGFSVDGKLLREMQLPEITAHILWEMTFHGFSDMDIMACRQHVVELEAKRILGTVHAIF